MGKNPSHFTACGAQCPVEKVSWLDAIGYVNALSKKEGLPACYDTSGKVIGGRTVYDCKGYRLPTEAEWEYAARGGTTGARYGDLDAVAWHRGNSGDKTHPVGKRRPNKFGLYDMLGNVWEWCHDWSGKYPSGSQRDPKGPSSGSYRVHRGGSWYAYAWRVRAANRTGGTAGGRHVNLGFRPARSIP